MSSKIVITKERLPTCLNITHKLIFDATNGEASIGVDIRLHGNQRIGQERWRISSPCLTRDLSGHGSRRHRNAQDRPPPLYGKGEGATSYQELSVDEIFVYIVYNVLLESQGISLNYLTET